MGRKIEPLGSVFVRTGTITVPPIGPIKAQGQTLVQLQSELVKKISE